MKKLTKSDDEWREQLSPESYRITRESGTERPHSGTYNHEWRLGVYHCICCGLALFQSDTKFDAGCGWPSFWKPLDGAHLEEVRDNSHGMVRIEIRCRGCDAHLGHVFTDGPPPTRLRYCINSVALNFDADQSDPEDP